MKKLFFLVFASAALYFAGCKPGPKSSEVEDTTATRDMVNEAMRSVQAMTDTMGDTAKAIMEDTTR